jgi:hypothetical protein
MHAVKPYRKIDHSTGRLNEIRESSSLEETEQQARRPKRIGEILVSKLSCEKCYKVDGYLVDESEVIEPKWPGIVVLLLS